MTTTEHSASVSQIWPLLFVQDIGYAAITVLADIDGFLTTFTDHASIIVQLPQLLQRVRLPIGRHQRALTGEDCSTESAQIEIAIDVQVNEVFAVRQHRGQCHNFSDKLIDPNRPIATKSDNLFGISAYQSTQTECSSM